jgi:hypothetical protein
MTDIKEKALALVNEVRRERDGTSYTEYTRLYRDLEWSEALCRAIEQHEAFKQEVSDAVEDAFGLQGAHTLHRFIIPKSDPLVEVIAGWTGGTVLLASDLRAALDARGLEIREKNDG